MSNTSDYTFSLESSQTPKKIYELLLHVSNWWSGLYAETIAGNSKKLNDEFTYKAGDGVHYSNQKLIELIPDEKIVWLITDSQLNFLEEPKEWTGTKICFEIRNHGNKTKVQFTHIGLKPSVECYNSCAPAWTQYLKNLAEKLK